MKSIYLIIVLSPLFGAIIAGFAGKLIGKTATHWIATGSVAFSFIFSMVVFKVHIFDNIGAFDETIYQWMYSGGIFFEIGFLVDNLTVIMMSVVTFVSLMVHIYTIEYMKDDEGYTRFFSFIALFTFAMLTLVMANNFMQLFLGWEAVGLVSYLLIGFWYKKETAIYANLKAFLVNRVGDFGFILGIALIVAYSGSLHYGQVFDVSSDLDRIQLNLLGYDIPLITLICMLLFIGAMGKSAQVPLHVWLPDSMEGPTPISALIHAATMVTAGIFMVARMSPLFELSEFTLSFIMIIGATTALFMGFIGLVQDDIKRVVAYSTLSQLGYMTVALGASAYSAALFHLMTHAFFKALLFLSAGSVIIAMHHIQDIKKMGGLKKYMPITYWVSLIGTLALIGFPGFSGFFSKDAIIEAVAHSNIFGSTYAYVAVLIGVLITSLYSFRMLFLVFHQKPRMGNKTKSHLKECSPIITIPLILLAIPSVIIGAITIEPFLFGDLLKTEIFVLPAHDVLGQMGQNYNGVFNFIVHSFYSPVLYLALSGILISGLIYLKYPFVADILGKRLSILIKILQYKYGIDELYKIIFAKASIYLGSFLSKTGDKTIIDGWIVNGSALLVQKISIVGKKMQTGFIYSYALVMIVGLIVLSIFLINF
ncbi:MAG: NADH-quinone oxidoreductase subunit L [Gammaproteobacteria bacterium]|nr:MAG: NADH-quinone oxidoreductase subunit L [Gammaproteobacteria bacterium]